MEDAMTIQSITPDQKEQFDRFCKDVCDSALEEINPDKKSLQRLIKRSDEFQMRIVHDIRRFMEKVSDYRLAREILGKGFISPEEIMRTYRNVVYTDDQLVQFSDTVPSHETIEWCRDNNYVLVAGPPRPASFSEVCNPKALDRFHMKKGCLDNEWYEDDFYPDHKVYTRWIMLRKEPIPGSINEDWKRQKAMLSESETVPNIAEVAWCVSIYEAVRSIRLLRQGIQARTSSFEYADGNQLSVFNSVDGLFVSHHDEHYRSADLGLLPSRKE
jgi:hypothetical protein